jgi:hypothetical protein
VSTWTVLGGNTAWETGMNLRSTEDKKSIYWEKALIFDLDGTPVRFTPDGRVSVIDAIRVVTDSRFPKSIWENIRTEHPEILSYCEDYSFQKEGPIPVVGSEGWERIWMLLPEFMSDPGML